MSGFVAIRGWVECDPEQFTAVKDVINADVDWYGGGWGFSRHVINGLSCAFYGGSVRESGVGWFLALLARVAAVAPAAGGYPRGLFVASHATTGMVQWHVAHGRVVTVPADPRHSYLDE